MIDTKVFISGPITGLPVAECTAKFEAAERLLRYAGYRNIFNPLKEVNQALPYEDQMKICLKEVGERDLIFCIDGWEDSPGARVEIMKAISFNKKVSCQSKLLKELRLLQH